jgi:N-acetylmuramoyl-L-alanine amidase
VQAIAVQGHPGTIDVCTVCHATQPTGAFVHRWLFSDLPTGFWARDQVFAAFSAGIVQGFPDDSYRPSLTITRDAMAVFVARAVAGGDANVPAFTGTASFADVPTTHWASKYIEYAKAAGIVTGYTDGLYHPNDVVDRGQMAVFVARSIVSPTGEAGLATYTPPTTPSFSDVATSFWAYKHIEYCAAQGVVLGFSDGAYHPEYAVTRDQMAVYLVRGFHLPTS